MSAVNPLFARQLAAASAQYDHASEPEPDWAMEVRAEEFRREYMADPERRDAAIDAVTTMFRGVGYVEMVSALDALAGVPVDRLIGSDALAAVLRLGDSWRRDIDAQLGVMARDEAEKEAAEFPRGFRP